MSTINKTATAVALSAILAGSAVQAGGFAEPLMEPEVIVAETAATTAGGIIVPLLLLALIAAVGAANGGGGTPVPPAIGPA